jgi:PTS system ascorbate-specific IIA component
MIGVLLITHGTLGEALVQCVSHVMNRRPAQLMQLGISGQDDPSTPCPSPGAWSSWWTAAAGC